MANDFSADFQCVALYRFENGSFETDSKGTDTLTASTIPPVVDNGQFKEGSWASLFTAATGDEYHYRTDANLSASFPLKSGTSNKIISVSLWFRCNTLPSAGNFMRVWTKSSYAGGARTISCDLFNNAGNTNVDHDFGKTDGSYSNNYGHGSFLSTATWYHYTMAYTDSTKALGLYLRDSSGNTIGSDVSTTTTDNIGLFSSSDWMIGESGSNAAPTGGSHSFDGWIDEVVVFNKAVTALDATNIAKGLYTGTGSAGLVGQMWLK